jgi:Mrp family chromosome partitioning ATPase
MDGTLLVIDSTRTHRATIRQAREALAKANARVIGVVLNRLANRRYAEDHPYSSYYDEETTAADVSPAMSTTAHGDGLSKTVSRLRKHADARPGK